MTTVTRTRTAAPAVPTQAKKTTRKREKPSAPSTQRRSTRLNPGAEEERGEQEQPSGIMPLSVVDVGVVPGLSEPKPTVPGGAPSSSNAAANVTGLIITTPGASSPPLEATEYGEDDADGDPDEGFILPPPVEQSSSHDPATQVLKKTTVPRISSPLKTIFTPDEDNDDSDMEEIISIHSSPSVPVSYYRVPATNTIWATACKYRIWEVQKRFNLDARTIRNIEEERADGYWRRHGWPSDLPDGAGSGLLTRTPPPSPEKLRSLTLSPSPTKLSALPRLTTPSSPAPSEDTSSSPSPSKRRKLDLGSSSSPETSSMQISVSEKRVTRSRAKASLESPTPNKRKARGVHRSPGIPASPTRITRSNSAAAPLPVTPTASTKKRKASTSAIPIKRRKSARLHRDDCAEEDEVERSLFPVSSVEQKHTLPPAWWDDDSSLSDLSDEDAAAPIPCPVFEDYEDEDEEDEDIELTEAQLAEFAGLMHGEGDEAFLNADLTCGLSPTSETSDVAPLTSSFAMADDAPIESTFYLPPLLENTAALPTPYPAVPGSPMLNVGSPPHMQQIPALPNLSSIPVPGLRQVDISAPKAANSLDAHPGGWRKGERELGLIGGWGTPVDRRRRSLWATLVSDIKGKGRWNDLECDDGRTGILERRERPVFGAGGTPGSHQPMLLSQFPGTVGSYQQSPQQGQQPTDWTTLYVPPAPTGTGVVNGSRPRVNGVEVETPEWEALVNGGSLGAPPYWGDMLVAPGALNPSHASSSSPDQQNSDWQWDSAEVSTQFLTSPSPDTLGALAGWDFNPSSHGSSTTSAGDPTWPFAAMSGPGGYPTFGGPAAPGGTAESVDHWFTQPSGGSVTQPAWGAHTGPDGGELRFALG